MSTSEAQLCEVFNSFQGEGLSVGERQTFIRFSGCNLSCQYCDSAEALAPSPEFKVEVNPGKKNFEKFKNPATISQLIEIVKAFGADYPVSLTGGEPLLQVDFLKSFLPELRKVGWAPPENEILGSSHPYIYLETNGTLPDHLSEVIELVDVVAMDIKLPSATGLSDYYKEHRKSLEIAYMKNVFVKIVFTKESKVKEFDEAVRIIADVDEKIPLVLQPVSPHGSIKHRPGVEQIFSFHNVAKRKLQNVKVIPQAHKVLGLT